jgi:hypothetical protein
VLFTVAAASTVALPVIAYLLQPKRMAEPLTRLRVWLIAHNSAVMTTLLAVIGFVLIGKGIGGLS